MSASKKKGGLFAFGFSKGSEPSPTTAAAKKDPNGDGEATGKRPQEGNGVRVNGHLTKKMKLPAPKEGDYAELAKNASENGDKNKRTSKKKKLIKKKSKSKVVDSESSSSSDSEMELDDEVPELKTASSSSVKRKTAPATPVSVSKRPKKSSTSSFSSSSSKLNVRTPPSKPASRSASPVAAPGSPKAGVMDSGEHEHHFLPWLAPDCIKDIRGRQANHPDYDATTLLVPDGYLRGKKEFHAPTFKERKITPSMQNWWDFKSKFFDCVLFYKVGKFYELYHMDADVGVKYLDLVYMRGDFAHCGFPEAAYGKYSEMLVKRGFRIARVEQIETPEMMTKRTGKKSGNVMRDVCSILSPGTRTLTVRDGIDGDLNIESRVALLSLLQRDIDKSTGTVEFGVCLCDPTTGRFSLGSFKDEANRSGLRMFLSRESVAEVCSVRSNLDERTAVLLRHMLPFNEGTLGTVLHTEIHDTGEHDAELEAQKFITYASSDNSLRMEWPPEGLQGFLQEDATKPKPDHVLELAALGLCVRILKRAKVEQELLSMKRFEQYVLPQTFQQQEGDDEQHYLPMVIDGQTLSNLEIFQSSSVAKSSKAQEGSLMNFLDRCQTAFGKRLLREWVRSPLRTRSLIIKRQGIVTALIRLWQTNSELQSAHRMLKSLPDLDRLLARIHALGIQKPSDHPDSKAILYDTDKLNKKKIESLMNALSGLKTLQEALELFNKAVRSGVEEDPALHSPLSRFCISSGQGTNAGPQDMTDALKKFTSSFDAEKARRLGSIIPKKGVAPAFDAAMGKKEAIVEKLDEVLNDAKDMLGVPKGDKIKYWNPRTGKDRFQIEIPDDVAKSARIPDSWQLKTKKKGARRYHTREIMNLLPKLNLAETELEIQSADATRQVFEVFDSKRVLWRLAVRAVAELDCFISLALVSANASDEAPMCMPQILLTDPNSRDAPLLELKRSRHPCVAEMLERDGKTFVPNDITVGGAENCLLLTGPNMGGKSTLLRQTCVAVVLAQIGCYVPAESCKLTPVDRIFTRLGASDRIMSGQSTFFVELDETATILQNATSQSLVILDELGRGTSTFDGSSIAHSVVEFLCREDLRCRTLFATHYHALVAEFQSNRSVKAAHMKCFANDKENDTDVTFLYELGPGLVDKSHGMNVARLARLPETLIKRAHEMSEKFEKQFLSQQILSDLQKALDPSWRLNKVEKEAIVEKLWKEAQKLAQ